MKIAIIGAGFTGLSKSLVLMVTVVFFQVLGLVRQKLLVGNFGVFISALRGIMFFINRKSLLPL